MPLQTFWSQPPFLALFLCSKLCVCSEKRIAFYLAFLYRLLNVALPWKVFEWLTKNTGRQSDPHASYRMPIIKLVAYIS
jgi:hypothetical protein